MGLCLAVQTMQVGEQSCLRVGSRYGYGSKGARSL